MVVVVASWWSKGNRPPLYTKREQSDHEVCRI